MNKANEVSVDVLPIGYWEKIQFRAYINNEWVGTAVADWVNEGEDIGIVDDYFQVFTFCKYPTRVKFALWKAMREYAKEQDCTFMCINCSGSEMQRTMKFLHNHNYKPITVVMQERF